MADPGKELRIELCAPEQPTKVLKAREVVLPGLQGVFAVLPEHTPMLAALMPGVMIVYPLKGDEKHYAVHGGFAETADDRILILTERFEVADDIDVDRAHAARERAEARLRAQQQAQDIDMARAEASLHRAIARIHAHSAEGY